MREGVKREALPASGASDDAAPKPGRRRFRLARTLVMVGLVWHIACVLVTGQKTVRDFTAPVTSWYCEGFKMCATWGMFGKPPRSADTVVVAEMRSGERIVMSSVYSNQKTIWPRIVDARLRKIQAKLETPKDRQGFGRLYLDYWCRQARAQHGDVRRVVAEIHQPQRLDDDGVVSEEASIEEVFGRQCKDPDAVAAPPRRGHR